MTNVMTDVKSFSNKTNFAAVLVVLAVILLCPASARAQWATNSNNISSTNTGNVGVGTAAPPSKFTVNVTSNADGITVDGTTNPMFSIKTSGVAKGYFGAATSTSAYAVGAAPGDIILRTQGGKFFFDTNSGVGTPALTIAGANGGVGIGTSTPSNALHVHNATGTQAMRVSGSGGGFMNFMDTAAGANQKLYQWRSEGGLFRLALANDSESSFAQQNLLVANSLGNVGIGTATPGTYQSGLSLGTGPRAFQLKNSADHAFLIVSAGGAGKVPLLDMENTDAAAGRRVLRFLYEGASNAAKFEFVNEVSGVTSQGNVLVVKNDGSVGIGTATPSAKLDVNGGLNVNGDISATGNISAKYQDVAEWVPSTQRLRAGTVVVLDTNKNNHVMASTKAYDTAVAGVISDSPGVILGEGGTDKLKVATTGRVKVKVDATRGAVKVGDLLVTSDVEGVAMKSVEVELGGVRLHRPGTIIGKALEPLASGTGEILVLLSLQ